ncbi:alpha/beta fold hydrolase [Roseobacter sp. HKCCD8198]|uniref:alpha/beta fold hydrolase n=1 Tax=unclassified Roseobacter TaxID=196798 RepID=UPI00345F7114
MLPDRRGHGDSGRPKRPEGFGMRMIEDVFCILDVEGYHTAHLVGFSQGSEVAWRAALEFPVEYAPFSLSRRAGRDRSWTSLCRATRTY